MKCRVISMCPLNTPIQCSSSIISVKMVIVRKLDAMMKKLTYSRCPEDRANKACNRRIDSCHNFIQPHRSFLELRPTLEASHPYAYSSMAELQSNGYDLIDPTPQRSFLNQPGCTNVTCIATSQQITVGHLRLSIQILDFKP